jgi:multimeric flavodoxin WrbA
MQKIYPKMDAADLIIFGTPLYWYGPTAKMKLLVDRMRPFVANRSLEGKKAVVVTPSADGAKACGPMLEMFRLCFEYLGMEFAGVVLVEAYEKGEVLDHPEEMEKAYEFGCSL